MSMRQRILFFMVFCLACSGYILQAPGSALAQTEESELKLSLSRDFGYASGSGDIQGTFSMKASGPKNLVKVEFLIDSQVVHTDTEAPFNYQFSTSEYPLGLHTLSAIGYTQDAQVFKSTRYNRNFVSAEEGGRAALNIVLPLFGIIGVLMLVSYLLPALFNRGKRIPLGVKRNYGLAGGTICPKCNRPFAFNIFAFKLIVGRLERCPHCSRWGVLRGYPIQMLRAAEAAELADSLTHAGQFDGQTEEEKLKKALDDSRYQDV